MQTQVIAQQMLKRIRKYFMIKIFMFLLQEKEDHKQMLARWGVSSRRKKRKSPMVTHAPCQEWNAENWEFLTQTSFCSTLRESYIDKVA